MAEWVLVCCQCMTDTPLADSDTRCLSGRLEGESSALVVLARSRVDLCGGAAGQRTRRSLASSKPAIEAYSCDGHPKNPSALAQGLHASRWPSSATSLSGSVRWTVLGQQQVAPCSLPSAAPETAPTVSARTLSPMPWRDASPVRAPTTTLFSVQNRLLPLPPPPTTILGIAEERNSREIFCSISKYNIEPQLVSKRICNSNKSANRLASYLLPFETTLVMDSLDIRHEMR